MANKKPKKSDPPMQATTKPAMALGFDWGDVEAVARHVVHLLQTQGEAAIGVAKRVMKLVQLATNRDLFGIITELNAASVDVQKIVDAINAEFHLEDPASAPV